MTIKAITSNKDDYIISGAEQAKEFIENNKHDIVSLAVVVVHKNGNPGFSFTTLEGTAKLSLKGAIDCLQYGLSTDFIDVY